MANRTAKGRDDDDHPHINCGSLQAPPNPKVICHCLLLEDEDGLTIS